MDIVVKKSDPNTKQTIQMLKAIVLKENNLDPFTDFKALDLYTKNKLTKQIKTLYEDTEDFNYVRNLFELIINDYLMDPTRLSKTTQKFYCPDEYTELYNKTEQFVNEINEKTFKQNDTSDTITEL